MSTVGEWIWVAHWWNKVKHSGKDVWQCHFVHHKFRILFVGGLLWANGLSLYDRQRTYSIGGVLIWRSKRSIRGKSLSLPLLSPQNPQRVAWIYALVCSMRSRTKITWAMARHFFVVKSRIWHFFFYGLQPESVLGRGIVEVSVSHRIRHTHTVGQLWQNNQLIGEAVTYRTHIK